ncbi:DNA internalization-related competence protein ComEC/Rec2 [Ideonella sp. B7]|uniref:DNA internalization-related competence protein ComEC/Rec2 n=1 Tax=Ideonella benzenivorans TaxID=2831643 RepID=UPI001CEC2876|nr:DNA internalization-related competence protein ComEC/Rec2 [Ideonella benzenivorans]MCA6216194.1 DNA internalization-related competence protein ComEC/Rec2 [Ideonella benzenivorans]
MLSGVGGVWTLSVLAWVCGVALQLAQAAVWPTGVDATLVGLAAGLVALAWRWRGRRRGAGVWALALLMAGAGSTDWRAAERLSHRLPAALEGQDLLLEGRVRGLPQLSPQGQVFLLDTERAWTQDAAAQARGLARPDRPLAFRARVRLVWSTPQAPGEPDPPGLARTLPRAGEAWRLPVRLRRPHGLANPGGFDAELWLFEQDIGATGSVRAAQPGQAVRLAGPRPWHPLEELDHARQAWRDRILLASPEARSAGLLAALAVGDQAAIDAQDWDLYRRTGIAHLVSISGSHITMFAALAMALVARLWRLRPGWALAVPAPQVGRWGGLLLATLYALLSGWGVPAQRTVWMLGTMVVLRSVGLPWPGWAVGAVAAAGTVAWDPWALLQPGFWLSFLAVALLMMQTEAGSRSDPVDPPSVPRRWWRSLAAAWRTQWAVTLGLAPLTLLFFGQLSLVGLPANLLAVPWVTWVITPLALLGVVWPPLWGLAGLALVPLHGALAWLSSLPWATWSVPPAGPWATGLALVGGGLAVARLPLAVRTLAVPMVLPLLVLVPPRPAPGQFELLAADVGQGSAVLIRTAHHLLLHDAGPRYGGEADAGQRVLGPLLQTLGEHQIDELVLSHRDTDHVGGAESLIEAVSVHRLRASLVAGHPLLGRVPDTVPCQAGQQWSWDGVDFQVLHPFTPAREGEASNAQSCVLRVRDAAGRQALLTGDIELAQEEALVRRWGTELRSEVLVVPHHGSHTSSGAEFLAAVAPQTAVMQQGYLNRFGHPHAEVLARYRQFGIKVVRTDDCGAWTWNDGGAECTRDVHPHYWQWGDRKPPPEAGAVVASSPKVGERE